MITYENFVRPLLLHRETPVDGTRCNRKLTEDAVRAIRKDTRQAVIVGPEYGVSPQAISDIRNGNTWRSVK